MFEEETKSFWVCDMCGKKIESEEECDQYEDMKKYGFEVVTLGHGANEVEYDLCADCFEELGNKLEEKRI